MILYGWISECSCRGDMRQEGKGFTCDDCGKRLELVKLWKGDRNVRAVEFREVKK